MVVVVVRKKKDNEEEEEDTAAASVSKHQGTQVAISSFPKLGLARGRVE